MFLSVFGGISLKNGSKLALQKLHKRLFVICHEIPWAQAIFHSISLLLSHYRYNIHKENTMSEVFLLALKYLMHCEWYFRHDHNRLGPCDTSLRQRSWQKIHQFLDKEDTRNVVFLLALKYLNHWKVYFRQAHNRVGPCDTNPAGRYWQGMPLQGKFLAAYFFVWTLLSCFVRLFNFRKVTGLVDMTWLKSICHLYRPNHFYLMGLFMFVWFGVRQAQIFGCACPKRKFFMIPWLGLPLSRNSSES